MTITRELLTEHLQDEHLPVTPDSLAHAFAEVMAE